MLSFSDTSLSTVSEASYEYKSMQERTSTNMNANAQRWSMDPRNPEWQLSMEDTVDYSIKDYESEQFPITEDVSENVTEEESESELSEVFEEKMKQADDELMKMKEVLDSPMFIRRRSLY